MRNQRSQARRAAPRRAPEQRDTGVPIALRNLPPDPPTVRPTFKRTLNIFDTSTSSSASLTLSYDALKTLIENQCFGSTTTFARYVINSIRVWGSAGDISAISIEDSLYGIVSSDSGTYARRPVVGISFPPSTRVVKSTSATGNIATIATAPEASTVIVYFNITLWTVATMDI